MIIRKVVFCETKHTKPHILCVEDKKLKDIYEKARIYKRTAQNTDVRGVILEIYSSRAYAEVSDRTGLYIRIHA